MLSVGSMFSGVGLLDYGLHLAGLHHTWFCEREAMRRAILAQRWPGAIVHDDVRTLGADVVPRVDCIAGGFPCKGASNAGLRNGFDHAETVLWREMRRTISELEPRYVLIENVANILALHDGAVWGEVLADMAALGFNVVWDCLPAAAVGAPHRRDRVLAVATYAGDHERRADEGQRHRDAWPSGVPGERPEGADQHDAGCPGALADPTGVGERAAHAQADAQPRGRDARALPRVGGHGAPADAERGVHGRARQGDVPGEAGAREGEGPQRQRVRLDAADGRGVPVEWGQYEPAIRRWEAITGPAPEPLVRRVDDGSTARVERSRLSALGDGVQVQIGRIAGAYIADLERERLSA